ncbi:hypothetical protein BJX99DRAFT_265470 [Aspergillus californicus]
MAPQDRVGLIPKTAFVVSTGVFLAIALLAALTRFTIRFGIQRRKRITIEDGLIILATALVTASVGINYAQVLDRLYLAVAIQARVDGVVVPPGWEVEMAALHRWYIAQGLLAWSALSAVKFNFLFFFKALISGLGGVWWRRYWWVTVGFNLVIVGAGIPAQLMCRAFSGQGELRCFDPAGNHLFRAYGIPLVVGDIIGEILILIIPIRLIWEVKVHWTQKILLGCFLCLTLITMSIAIIRLSQYRYRSALNQVWQAYWVVLETINTVAAMADPFSIAGSTVGVVSLGLQVCNTLVTYCRSVKDADQDIQTIANKAAGLRVPLKTLRDTRGTRGERFGKSSTNQRIGSTA